jgi:hypothetical protein
MSGQDPTRRPWSLPVALDDIPETGRRVELVADADTRAAVAKVAGVSGLPLLRADFDLAPQGRDALRVVGAVSATVEQTCVVTLEPVVNEVEEPVDLLFVAQPEAGAPKTGEGSLAIDAAEPPEPLVGGVVDLGAVATEFLLLGIDPYPRKPDAVFAAPSGGGGDSRPFAALAALRNDPRRKKS